MRIELAQLGWLENVAKGVAGWATASARATDHEVAGGEGDESEHDAQDGEHANSLRESESPPRRPLIGCT
jgi:hypothetical protein